MSNPGRDLCQNIPAMKKYNVLLLFVCCLLSRVSSAQAQYDINDPRNPDCPCHKYQRQAEDEYARMNKTEGSSSNIKSKRRRRQPLTSDLNFRFYKNKKGIKRGKGSGIDCFYW